MYVSGSVTIKVMVSSYTITSSDNTSSEDDAELMNKMAKFIMEDNIPYEKVTSKICDTRHEFWEQYGLQKIVCFTSVEDTKGTISCMGALSFISIIETVTHVFVIFTGDQIIIQHVLS